MTQDANLNPQQVDQFNRNLGTGTDRLGFFSRAVDRAAGAFGGVIRGAPQGISEFSDALSQLSGENGVLRRVAASAKFAEGYVTVWQELTNYGINFGNQLDEMIIQAGAANMKMEQLGRIVQQSSSDFAALGSSANRGVQQFLGSQADFYRSYRDLDMSLRQLGLSTDDINQRFLQFDTISQIGGMRQRMDERQRAEAGTRFVEAVDRLAKLTGKQAEELAREQVALSRQGNIYARDQELVGKATEGTTARLVQQFNLLGDEVGAFATDIITRGFADGSPANRALRAMASDLEPMLQGIRRAQDAGNLQEVERLEREAVAYMARVRESRNAQLFALQNTATEEGVAANRIMTGLNNAAQIISDGEIRATIAREKGIRAEEVSIADVARRREEMLAAEVRGQRSGQGSRAVTDLMLETLQALQLSASAAQERAVKGIFDEIQEAAGELRDGIARIDWNGMVQAAISEVSGTMSSLAPGRDFRAGLQGMQQAFVLRAQAADTRGNTATADLLEQSSRDVGRIIRDLNAGRITEEDARRQAAAIESAMTGIGALEIRNIERMDVESIDLIRELGSSRSASGDGTTPGQNIGTFGRTGSFFSDYGPGTDVRLHGIEGVFRPNHIEEIMERSSRGTIQALVNDITTRGFPSSDISSEMGGAIRNITATLDNRLNTIRANVSREIRQSQPFNPEMIGEQLRTALSSMPTDMRKAFEDAFGNTLKQPMEQLVSVSTRGTDYQERVYKNTRGISQDYLRGA